MGEGGGAGADSYSCSSSSFWRGHRVAGCVRWQGWGGQRGKIGWSLGGAGQLQPLLHQQVADNGAVRGDYHAALSCLT
jgi:hypothetical protein